MTESQKEIARLTKCRSQMEREIENCHAYGFRFCASLIKDRIDLENRITALQQSVASDASRA